MVNAFLLRLMNLMWLFTY